MKKQLLLALLVGAAVAPVTVQAMNISPNDMSRAWKEESRDLDQNEGIPGMFSFVVGSSNYPEDIYQNLTTGKWHYALNNALVPLRDQQGNSIESNLFPTDPELNKPGSVVITYKEDGNNSDGMTYKPDNLRIVEAPFLAFKNTDENKWYYVDRNNGDVLVEIDNNNYDLAAFGTQAKATAYFDSLFKALAAQNDPSFWTNWVAGKKNVKLIFANKDKMRRVIYLQVIGRQEYLDNQPKAKSDAEQAQNDAAANEKPEDAVVVPPAPTPEDATAQQALETLEDYAKAKDAILAKELAEAKARADKADLEAAEERALARAEKAAEEARRKAEEAEAANDEAAYNFAKELVGDADNNLATLKAAIDKLNTAEEEAMGARSGGTTKTIKKYKTEKDLTRAQQKATERQKRARGQIK